MKLLRGYGEPKVAYTPVMNLWFGPNDFPAYKEDRAMRMLFLLFPAIVMVGASPAMAQQQRTPSPAMRAACSGDVQRLCAGIKPGGGRIGECLKAHVHEVSPQCKEAFRASKAGAAPR